MHIGHSSAGWRSAVIYSITGTSKLLKINLGEYLTWVLPGWLPRPVVRSTHFCRMISPPRSWPADPFACHSAARTTNL